MDLRVSFSKPVLYTGGSYRWGSYMGRGIYECCRYNTFLRIIHWLGLFTYREPFIIHFCNAINLGGYILCLIFGVVRGGLIMPM